MNLRKFLPGKLGKTNTVIPVVRMMGAIAAGGGRLGGRTLSLAAVAGPLAKAFAMKDAPCVAISVNSPGGSPVQSRLIFSRIRELAAQHEKKVIIFVEDVAASGGYMIALAGDEIIADETSIVGSIGVVSASFGFNKAIEKLGIDRRVYTAGQNKVSLDPFQPEKKSDIDYLKKLQLEIHQIFIDMVKERRSTALSDDKDIFTGRFWTAIKGKELGLIDGFGHMSSVLKERYGEDTKLKLVQEKKRMFGLGSLGGIGNNLGRSVADEALQIAEERALYARYGL